MNRWAGALACVALAGGLTAIAEAQEPQIRSFGVGARMGGGDVTKRDVGRMAEILGLDADQKSAAEALYEPIRERIAAVRQETRKEMDAARAEMEDGDLNAIREKMPAIAKKSREKIDALQKSYLDDLRSLLRPEQADRWERVERYRRRTEGLRGVGISGAGVDLIELVRGLKLPDADSTKAAEILNQYELDIDRVLAEHAAAQKAAGEASGDTVVILDRESMDKQMKAEREHGLKLREINHAAARKLSAAVSPEAAAKLEEKFRTQSFRSIYRQGEAARTLAAAQKLSDLRPDQREKLRAIAERYQRDVRAANDRWATAQERAETAGKTGGLTLGGMGGGMAMFGEKPDPELVEARKARRELDAKAKQEMESVLTPDQVAQLPKNDGGSRESTRVMGTPGGSGTVVIVTQDEITDGDDEGGGEGDVIIERRAAPR